MFGDLDGHINTNREHNLVPILKLIDFGEAQELDPPAVPGGGSKTSGGSKASRGSDSDQSTAAQIAAMEKRLEELRLKEIEEYDKKIGLDVWVVHDNEFAELSRRLLDRPGSGVDYLYV